jgi:hypothetical protein
MGQNKVKGFFFFQQGKNVLLLLFGPTLICPPAYSGNTVKKVNRQRPSQYQKLKTVNGIYFTPLQIKDQGAYLVYRFTEADVNFRYVGSSQDRLVVADNAQNRKRAVSKYLVLIFPFAYTLSSHSNSLYYKELVNV